MAQSQILLEEQSWLALVRTVRAALNQGRSLRAFESLLALLDAHPKSWLTLEDGRVLYADLLLRCRQFSNALETIEAWNAEDLAGRADPMPTAPWNGLSRLPWIGFGPPRNCLFSPG